MEKYPVEDGEKWSFTCQYHKDIDDILNEENHDE